MALVARTASPVAYSNATSAFAQDVVEGLTSSPKRIPPKYFYDNEGSRLFAEITQLPEYYPTRTECGILRENAPAMAALIPAGGALVEFGSGSAIKARILLDSLPELKAYVPVDICAGFLEQEAGALRAAYPNLSVLPVAADFTKPFELPEAVQTLPRAGFFPGSTIGNFEPHEASAFLRNAAKILGNGALLIIGVDLVKDTNVLQAAYNDSKGITERFNLNILERMNRELSAGIDLASFEHHAFYNRERQRIEMHLASLKRQRLKIVGATVDFRVGETIHTENSYKYTLESFGALARGSGWATVSVWKDSKKYFSVHALRAEPKAAG
jgi:dimethylhistidine N-methyltransferase